MNFYLKQKNGFFTLLGIVLTMAIILVLFYYLFNTYFKQPVVDKESQKSFNEYNIDTANYKTIMDSTRDRVKGIEKDMLNQSQQWQDMQQQKD